MICLPRQKPGRDESPSDEGANLDGYETGMPKISIVTISFNQAKYLESAIESVVSQDYDDLEYIIVDPGSTDDSLDIIARYEDKISRICLEADSGPAEGLNNGFSMATGDILGFLNADDVLERGAIARVAECFVANNDIDVVSGHSWIIDETGSPLRRFYSDRFSLWMAAHGAAILSQPSTFFRSEIFRRVGGFNVSNKSNWDGELFIDMAIVGGRFAVVPYYWSKYRIHTASITGSGRLDDLHRTYRDRMFRKIMRRDIGRIDSALGAGAKYLRKILNPRDTIERLVRGPVYRSSA